MRVSFYISMKCLHKNYTISGQICPEGPYRFLLIDGKKEGVENG